MGNSSLLLKKTREKASGEDKGASVAQKKCLDAMCANKKRSDRHAVERSEHKEEKQLRCWRFCLLPILLVVPFYAACRVDKLLLPRKKRMATGTDFQSQISGRGPGLKRVTTDTCNNCFLIFRMNSRSHCFAYPFVLHDISIEVGSIYWFCLREATA